jgi:hypothetical protein
LQRRCLWIIGPAILGEVAETDRRPGFPLAFARLELAAEDREQNRLAGAVLADNPDALTAQHGQVGLSERTYFALVRRNSPKDIPILNLRWEEGDHSAPAAPQE